MNEEQNDYLFKIVILGDSGVGKTNLLSRFTKNSFNENTRNTIGVDFSAVDTKINKKSVKAQFWDTAGQEKYRAIASAYYKNAHGAIIVYDITKRNSFDNVNEWIDELQVHGGNQMELLILGNKVDLEIERHISEADGLSLAQKYHAFFMETSAKQNDNDCVGKAFNVLLSQILKKIQEIEDLKVEEEMGADRSQVEIRKKSNHGKDDKTCC